MFGNSVSFRDKKGSITSSLSTITCSCIINEHTRILNTHYSDLDFNNNIRVPVPDRKELLSTVNTLDTAIRIMYYSTTNFASYSYVVM